MNDDYKTPKVRRIMLRHGYEICPVNEQDYPEWYKHVTYRCWLLKDVRYPETDPQLIGLSELRDLARRLDAQDMIELRRESNGGQPII
jgi:hypothetical protein